MVTCNELSTEVSTIKFARSWQFLNLALLSHLFNSKACTNKLQGRCLWEVLKDYNQITPNTKFFNRHSIWSRGKVMKSTQIVYVQRRLVCRRSQHESWLPMFLKKLEHFDYHHVKFGCFQRGMFFCIEGYNDALLQFRWFMNIIVKSEYWHCCLIKCEWHAGMGSGAFSC